MAQESQELDIARPQPTPRSTQAIAQQPAPQGGTNKVYTKHAQYQQREKQWARCRDCYDGSDAVKDQKVARAYLPPLDTQVAMGWGGDSLYEAYKTRALYYNAMGRTVNGLAGVVFQKTPKMKIPTKYEKDMLDVTLRGEPSDLVALIAMREVLTTGRYGVLVDVTSGTKPRSYWTGYKTEDIVNWRETRIDDNWVTTLVILREDEWVPDKNDPEFVVELRNAYRVLRLRQTERGLVYTTQRYHQVTSTTVGAKMDAFEPEGEKTPSRRGKPLDFIPFTFFGPTSVAIDVQKPPLIDLADINLSHYRTSADLEHGRHYVSLPTPWMAGAEKDNMSKVTLGPAGMLILEKGGAAGMLEFSGSGLGSLERADDTKRKMMATVGARMLEDQGGPAETATAVTLRHSGEHATLKTITGAIERGFSEVARTHVWWAEGAGPEWEDVDVSYELNKDFFAQKMSSEDAKTLVLMLQAEAISYESFWDALRDGNYLKAIRTAKEEKAQIDKERPEPTVGAPGAPGVPGAPGLPGGVGGVKPGSAGAQPPAATATGGAVRIPPGTHLVKDAGIPGAPKPNASAKPKP